MLVTRLLSDEVSGRNKFGFEGIDVETFSALRHALFKDVPILAVDTVTFHKYDGIIESEMVSHRIGQLPVRFASDNDQQTAIFEIDVIAPADGKAGITWVTSRDVICKTKNAHVVHYRSEAEASIALHDKGFLLIPLHPGQRALITFEARVSTGREATRWASVFVAAKLEPSMELTVETTGAVTPQEALKLACRVTVTRLEALSDALCIS